MKKFIDEFKQFAVKGNVVDLAIGIVIGGAFGKIVSSLVSDLIMPLLGVITGNVNLSGLKYVVTPKNGAIEEFAIKYGNFLQSIIDFIIIAFSVFMFIKLLNSFKRKQEETPSVPSTQELLLTEIRDLLKERVSKE